VHSATLFAVVVHLGFLLAPVVSEVDPLKVGALVRGKTSRCAFLC
jgi:hypothetical protein